MIMKLSIPSISIESSITEIAQSIEQASDGLLFVTDLPTAPFDSMRDLMKESKQCANRLNQAYPKNLVYKDAHASGNGGPHIDRKRVLDLSPERIEAIQAAEPDLLQRYHTENSALDTSLIFWEQLQETAAKTILPALAQAIGSDDVTKDAAFNYRMVDYYKIDTSLVANDDTMAPRCQEHRDFGSFTLIFADQPGLQVFVDNEWKSVPSIPAGSAILLFGWCTQIRSNGRIPAVLHKVSSFATACAEEPRTSAVLFCAPKKVETPLEPVLKNPAHETRQYVSGIKVGQLRGNMARKWRHREGTLSAQDRYLEEEEVRVTNMKSQDDVVARTVKVV